MSEIGLKALCGKGESGALSLRGLVFADNLPRLKEFALTVSATVTKTVMSVDELCSLGRAAAAQVGDGEE